MTEAEDQAKFLYEALSARFESTHHDTRGGVQLEYLTGEQVTTRLNEVLSPMGWSFEILSHGYVDVTDEEWVRGRLTVHWNGVQAAREQFGSQKRNKNRSGAPMEVGMDMKGAATDCMKKCASLFGVGLYLSVRRQDGQRGGAQQSQQARPPIRAIGPKCQFAGCPETVTEHEFSDGTKWTIPEIIKRSQEQFNKVYCYTHLKSSAA